MKSMQYIKSILLTAIAPIVWGSTYIVTTEMLPAESPLVASTIRALPAGIILVLFSNAYPQGIWWRRIAILGLLNISLFFYCLFFAATYLPGGMAAVVMSIQPLLIMVLSRYYLSMNYSVLQLSASGLGAIGVALLVLNSESQLNITGVALGLLGAFSMALGVVLTKKWGKPKEMTTIGFTGWQLLFGGVALLPTSLWLEGIPQQLTLVNYAGYGYLSIVGAMLSYFLWFRGLESLPSVTVSFIGLLSSVSACLLGYIVLGETFTWWQSLGAIVVILAIVLVASPTRSHSNVVIEN
nr:EamA family transporter [Vibrio sp. MACH09]